MTDDLLAGPTRAHSEEVPIVLQKAAELSGDCRTGVSTGAEASTPGTVQVRDLLGIED